MSQFHTMILTDGSQVTVSVIASGPSGVISAPRLRPTLYLKDLKHGRYYRVPQDFTDADIPALQGFPEEYAKFLAVALYYDL
jgi:hypothetical protein